MMASIEWIGLSAALLTGAIGSAHCFGMCGGLSAALGMRHRTGLLQASNTPRSIVNALPYQLGRLSGYALIGAIAGTFSQAAQWIPGLIDLGLALRVASGVLLLLIAIRMLWGFNALAPIERLGGKMWRRLQPITRRLMNGESIAQRLSMGLLWGWLPCGMVYSMAALALLSGSTLQGALLMIAFGLGTLPAMTLTTAFGSQLKSWSSGNYRRASGSVLVAFAIFFIASPFYLSHSHSAHQHGALDMEHDHHAMAHDETLR